MRNVQERRRLVQQQDVRALGQGHRRPGATQLPVREVLEGPAAQRRQAHRLQRPLHGLAILGGIAFEGRLMWVTAALDEFVHAQLQQAVEVVANECQLPGDKAAGQFVDRFPVQEDDAGLGLHRAAQDLQERGLAGAIGSDQASHHALFNDQVCRFDREGVAVACLEVPRFQSHVLVRIRYRRKGAPIAAVTIPSGISTGASTTRAKVSEYSTRIAPSTAERGMSVRWSSPVPRRARCGTTRPTTPPMPAPPPAAPASHAATPIAARRDLSSDRPRDWAASSPRLRMFMFRASIIAATRPTPAYGKMIRRSSQPRPNRPPASQASAACVVKFDVTSTIVVPAERNEATAPPARASRTGETPPCHDMP